MYKFALPWKIFIMGIVDVQHDVQYILIIHGYSLLKSMLILDRYHHKISKHTLYRMSLSKTHFSQFFSDSSTTKNLQNFVMHKYAKVLD